MNVKKWVWCLHCERCFEAYLSGEPIPDDAVKEQTGEGAFSFAADFEMQFGVEENGVIYARCPYDGCDGGLLDFWWWDDFRANFTDLPEVPEPGRVYPLSASS